MKKEPLVLAVETAISKGSFSILRGETVIASYVGETLSLRADNLLKLIKKAFDENGVSLSEVDLLAVSTGPGSFTGIRVGLSTLQALSLGLNCPLVGVSVFEALAYDKKGYVDKKIAAAIMAGRNRILWQIVSSETNLNIEASQVKSSSYETFVEDVKNAGRKNGDLLLLLDSRLKSEPLLLEKTKNDLQVSYASDNVAFLVALHALRKLNEKEFLNQPLIQPNYFQEVEIGSKK